MNLRTPFVAVLVLGASLASSGNSQGGQEWVQRYGIYKKSRFLMISLHDGKGSDNGGGSVWDGDALSRFVFDVDFGGGFAEPDPTMLDGAARQDVKTITFEFSDRPSVSVHPYLASRKLRHRSPFLRHIRFYIVFFSGGEGTLQTATACDAAGRTLKVHRFGG